MSDVDLPEPWVLGDPVEPDVADQLEALVGSGLTLDQLDRGMDTEELGGGAYAPRSDRAMRVMGRKWVRLLNVDADTMVLIRLQHSLGASGVISITSVIYPDEDSRALSGADLRGLPVAAIAAAFTAHEQRGRSNMKILFALGDAVKDDPLALLPAASAQDAFTARVARQYVALQDAKPSANTAKEMAAHNNVPLPSVQRWIARARKRGFLPPADARRGGSRGTPADPAE